MIVIDKAILHILDLNSGMTVFSDEVLSMENSIETFFLKHIEKSFLSQEAKPGRFYDDSECKKDMMSYVSGELDFVAFSKALAKRLEQALLKSEEMVSSDLLICDVRIDDVRKIVIFNCKSHIGFVHQVTQTTEGIKNEIINHYAIMPGLTQKIDEFAFIDTQTLEISVAAKKYTIDGNSIFVLPEILLECELASSPKETIKKISDTIQNVAEAYGQDDVAALAAMKSYITENIQSSDELDPFAAGKSVFKDNLSMQTDYDQQIKDAGILEPVKVDPESTLKKMRNHK